VSSGFLTFFFHLKFLVWVLRWFVFSSLKTSFIQLEMVFPPLDFHFFVSLSFPELRDNIPDFSVFNPVLLCACRLAFLRGLVLLARSPFAFFAGGGLALFLRPTVITFNFLLKTFFHGVPLPLFPPRLVRSYKLNVGCGFCFGFF